MRPLWYLDNSDYRRLNVTWNSSFRRLYLTAVGARMSLAFCFTASASRYLRLTCLVNDRFCSGKRHCAPATWLLLCLLLLINVKLIWFCLNFIVCLCIVV